MDLKKMIAIFNAFVHDTASGLWMATVFAIYWIHIKMVPPGMDAYVFDLKKGLFYLCILSLVIIAVTGMGRTMTYTPGAHGHSSERLRKQMLIAKHIVGILVYGGGTFWIYSIVYV